MNPKAFRQTPLCFGLRAVLLVITIACTAFGPLANQVHNHRRALDFFHERGAVLAFGEISMPHPNCWQKLQAYLFLPSPCRIQLTGDEFAAGDLSSLRHVATLEGLTLSGIPIRDDWLRHLPNSRQLRMLDLSNTLISDQGLRHLRDMKYLKRLYLENTQVSPEGIDQLRRKLPDCTIVF